MVSQDFSMEPASTVLHQCLISNMNTNPVETEELAYSLQFQPNVVPHYFNPLEERLGINSGNGHGLSLTLGSQIPSEFRKDEHANAADSSYLSNGEMVCGGETNSTSRVYNTSNASNNQTFDSMASIITSLQNSPYMKLAQELLDEVVCVSNQAGSGPEKNVKRFMGIATGDTRSFRDGEIMNLNEGDRYSSDENNAVHIKISKLVALLDQLESRYDQYFHQMDMVVSSFESVAGVGAAASYTALTIQAMSKHFSNLRDSIIMQLNASRESLSQDQSRNSDRSSKPKRETLQNLGVIQIRQVWRPLRGLPEESVALLRSWLFDHFLHPYPSDNEKLMLASQTGLTRNQISNWFINARVRLWKPMIEEMYKEEFADDMQD